MKFPNGFIEEMASQLSGQFSQLSEQKDQIKNDVEKNVKAMVSSGLEKLDLVTREEFETQQQVLLRTREKLEALEKIVSELESK